jgi:acetolactate synthase small subunit
VAEERGAELMRRIISVLMENEAGALSRVVGLFAQRNYNIETLTVAPTEDETLSRLTLTTSASDTQVEQITKQLNKLIEIVKLVDLTDGDYIERELMLIKVKATGAQRRKSSVRRIFFAARSLTLPIILTRFSWLAHQISSTHLFVPCLNLLCLRLCGLAFLAFPGARKFSLSSQ